MSSRSQDIKKATAESQRRRMNERRHELTQKIRKTKRSHIVARKRRFVSSPETIQIATPIRADAQDPGANSNLAVLASTYVRTKDAATLKALQSALAKSSGEASSLLLQTVTPDVLPSEDTPAMQLANTLAYSLLDSQSTVETRLMAARVLTNLAATENAQTRDADNYYQRQPEGWCDVLVQSQALPAMVRVIDSTSHNSTTLLLQCCWAIGNICGDSETARNATREAGVLGPLIKALQNGLEWNHIGTCRNAAWAMSNLARGSSPGLTFLQQLSPLLLAQVMMTPEQRQSSNVDGVTWWDVTHEMCWVLAFLSAKEDEAVDLLMMAQELSFSSQHASAVCEALACRLETSTRVIRTADSVDGFARALRMAVPCLRAVGNIATASEGRHIPFLLSARGGSIVKSLATVVELGSFPSSVGNGDLASVAVEAAWAAGSLLCDAGLPDHPSSTVASPVLLPVLSKVVTSEYAKLDLKREAVSAIWNAVAAPPAQTMVKEPTSRAMRNEFLTNMTTVPGFVRSLTYLLTSVDMDAALASIQVMNALLRHASSEKVRQEFLEVEGVDRLEQVCDRASEVPTGRNMWEDNGASSQCADIAAALVDDLFDNEEEEMDLGLAPEVSASGTFAFGVATEAPQMFDFGGTGTATAMANNATSIPPQGRGRGKPIPSWMSKNNSAVMQDSRKTGSYPW